MNAFPPARFLDRRTPPHLATLVLLAATGAITMNIFLASLPVMAEDFGVSYAVMQIAVTGYLALTGLSQLVIGPLSDRYGRRPVAIWTVAIFIAASIGTALATDISIFLLFRALQTSIISGYVISRATIRDVVAREDAASRLGYVTMGMALAPMIAPTVGGMLGDAFGWRASFYALTLAGILTLLVVWFDQGETNVKPSASFGEQFRSYPALIRSHRFWGYTMTMTFASGTFFAFLGGAPFVGDVVYGLSATQVGMYLAITPMGYVTGNGISGRFASRFGLYRMILTGALVTLIGMSMTLLTSSPEPDPTQAGDRTSAGLLRLHLHHRAGQRIDSALGQCRNAGRAPRTGRIGGGIGRGDDDLRRRAALGPRRPDPDAGIGCLPADLLHPRQFGALPRLRALHDPAGKAVCGLSASEPRVTRRIERLARHFQMQLAAFIRMRPRHVFIEFDPQTRCIRHHHMSLLERHR
jgi:DHA1 family bicyclomycin/chloramphenicol resistance-like MFS transporter